MISLLNNAINIMVILLASGDERITQKYSTQGRSQRWTGCAKRPSGNALAALAVAQLVV